MLPLQVATPWVRLRRLMLRYFTELRWYTVAAAFAAYAASSWLLLALAGESALTDGTDFFYWLVVTGSTVGYGDLSPQTPAGRWLVALYVIPLGLSIFALVVGRVAAWVALQWRKGRMGLKPLALSGHIVVIGWNGPRTVQLLRLLLDECADMDGDTPAVVLCVRAEIDNPMPGEIEFVRVGSFNQDEDMDRACIGDARTILIDNPEDDMTMTTALYCSHRNPAAHQVAYFKDESLVRLLHRHCPKVECTPSVAVEMLAKSAFDPGSSMLHHDLLNVAHGHAQYSVAVPPTVGALAFDRVFLAFKRRHDATAIGIAPGGNYHQMQLNPPLDATVRGGDTLFYIADQRVHGIDWEAL